MREKLGGVDIVDSLYGNVGLKLKNWAMWMFIVETITAIIAGIALMFEDAAFVGFIVLICGPIVAFISTWLLYAFGELVEKTAANEENTREILKVMKSKEAHDLPAAPKVQAGGVTNAPAKSVTNRTKVAHAWRCAHCEQMIPETPCKYCGK